MAQRKASDDEVLAVIVEQTQKQGGTTVRQVAEALGISSSATAWNRIQRLRDRGLVETRPGRWGLRASGAGVAVLKMAPETLRYDLEVRIDPAAAVPVSVVLTQK